MKGSKLNNIITLIITLILLISCEYNNPEIDDIAQKKPNKNYTQSRKTIIDTILEKNNPKNIDLSKHQLFIDTTRNSEFYKAILDWKPDEFDKKGAEYYLKEISKKHLVKNVSIGDFSKNWISLSMLKNNFVIYDRCDGITPRYYIDTNSVIFYSIEPDLDIIHKIINISNEEIILELRTIPQKSQSEKAILSIKKTRFEDVYILKCIYDNYEIKELVTPIEKIYNFDLVINHCVDVKIAEYNGFDKINYDEY